MFKRKKDGGFTLIELMIVIAVIGILAVVLVPKFGGIKSQAKGAGIEVNAHSVEAYVSANISKWAEGTYVDDSVGLAIYNTFSKPDNQLKNPYSKGVTIGRDATLVASSTIKEEDAVQLVTVANNADTDKGTVVVLIPTTQANLISDGITITGYDDNGNQVTSKVVKP